MLYVPTEITIPSPLTEWKRLHIECLIYRETLKDILDMDQWSQSEKDICEMNLKAMLTKNFSFMTQLEQMITNYKFKVHDLYCLN